MELIIPGDPQVYALRLVAYAPNGNRLGLLSQATSFETAHPLNDIPSAQLTYQADAAGAALLDEPCEIAVEYAAGDGTWVEPPDGRFLRIKRSGDLTDLTGSRRYSCPGYAWQLRKLVLYPGGVMADGKRQFSAVSAGALLRTMVNEGRDRGTLLAMAVDFTASTDSAGAAWASPLTLGLDPGTSLLAMLINLADQGVIDWRMQGRTLQVYNAGTFLARDLASGLTPVDLRLGRDIDQAPDDVTLEDAASAVLIRGEEGLSVEVTNPSAVAPWGRWETYQSQGGVTDSGTATLLGQYTLSQADGERAQLTRQIIPRLARWLPFADYRPGDYLLAPGEGGIMQSLRVRQITLTRDQDGTVAGNLVLGDRFLERDIKNARKAAGIMSGLSTGGSGTAAAPESSGRTPAAPAGLVVTPDAYVDEHGYARGQITAVWLPVVADVNGTAIDVDGYELYARLNESGEIWQQITSTTSGDTNATYSPLTVNAEYAFKIRATANGAKGLFSAEQVVLIPDDVVAPPVPTAPIVSTRLGVIKVEWDGQGVGPVAMPADFDRVRVWMTDGVGPYEEIGSLTAAGAIIVVGEPYEEDRTFRLTAADRSGNESAASATATIATTPLVDTDLIGEVIDGANIVDGTITASDKVVANSITGALIQALSIAAGHIQANAITADKITAGAVTAAKVAADAIDGKTITGAYIRTASTGQRLELAPPGATYPEMRLYPGSGSNYTVLQTRDDINSGEATLVITSSQNAAATYRAQLQMGATLTRINVKNETASSSKGGLLDVASTYARFGYNDGSASTESFIHLDGSGRYYIRGKFWDFTALSAYEAVMAGSVSIPGAGGSPNWGQLYYGPIMASNMGPVCTIRDGGAGGSPDSFIPRAWSVTVSNTEYFQVNLNAASSFALYWWAHRHG